MVVNYVKSLPVKKKILSLKFIFVDKNAVLWIRNRIQSDPIQSDPNPNTDPGKIIADPDPNRSGSEINLK